MSVRIIGIDPGFGRMGYGIVDGQGSQVTHVAHGCVETSPKASFGERLLQIADELTTLIATYHPTRASIEELFFYNNAKTAIDVGQARGVILLTLLRAGLPVDEFTPPQVKQAMTGHGGADKAQVARMVQIMLKMPAGKLQDDAADALAIALTAAASLGLRQKSGQV